MAIISPTGVIQPDTIECPSGPSGPSGPPGPKDLTKKLFSPGGTVPGIIYRRDALKNPPKIKRLRQ
jgi:hypothetical protein